jgi:hypothetical protein
MAGFTERVRLEVGWAEAAWDPVRVGDRVLPRKITAVFESVAGRPGLELDVEVVRGVPQCRRIAIVAAADGEEVRQVDVAAVRVDEWVAAIVAAFAKPYTETPDGAVRIEPQTAEEEAEARDRIARARRLARRRGPSAVHLDDVARIYREHLDDAPAEAVARALGVGRRQAGNYIAAARREGHLPPTTRGRKRA